MPPDARCPAQPRYLPRQRLTGSQEMFPKRPEGRRTQLGWSRLTALSPAGVTEAYARSCLHLGLGELDLPIAARHADAVEQESFRYFDRPARRHGLIVGHRRTPADVLAGACTATWSLMSTAFSHRPRTRRQGQRSRAGSAAPAWHCPTAASMNCAGSRPRPATHWPWTRFFWRLHVETACRRGGAVALTPDDLDPEQCLIRLREKSETMRWQPISLTLMRHLPVRGESRGGLGNGQRLLRYTNGMPITKKRYDHLWRRLGEQLPWGDTLQVSNVLDPAHHTHLGSGTSGTPSPAPTPAAPTAAARPAPRRPTSTPACRRSPPRWSASRTRSPRRKDGDRHGRCHRRRVFRGRPGPAWPGPGAGHWTGRRGPVPPAARPSGPSGPGRCPPRNSRSGGIVRFPGSRRGSHCGSQVVGFWHG